MSEQKDVSADWQTRAEELEQLALDLLACLKDYTPMPYEKGLRARALQDRAAALGIVLELSPAEKYNAMIDARNKILLENREKPWLPPSADGEL